jgi:hypothetical protein
VQFIAINSGFEFGSDLAPEMPLEFIAQIRVRYNGEIAHAPRAPPFSTVGPSAPQSEQMRAGSLTSRASFLICARDV